MLRKPIELKGSSFTLSVIYVHDAKPEEIRLAIEKKVKQAPEFLKYAPVIINVANLSHDTPWYELSKAVLSTGLHIVGVSGCNNNILKQAIISSGLPLLNESRSCISEEKSSKYNAIITSTPIVAKTKLINMPIRSGQKIYASNSDLIIIGNVNAGAELIADGNIHIYGMMRGRALAGASGDRACQIFCTYFSPELISIAGQYWLNEQIPIAFSGKAARLCLQHSKLTIHSLI